MLILGRRSNDKDKFQCQLSILVFYIISTSISISIRVRFRFRFRRCRCFNVGCALTCHLQDLSSSSLGSYISKATLRRGYKGQAMHILRRKAFRLPWGILFVMLCTLAVRVASLRESCNIARYI